MSSKAIMATTGTCKSPTNRHFFRKILVADNLNLFLYQVSNFDFLHISPVTISSHITKHYTLSHYMTSEQSLNKIILNKAMFWINSTA